MKTKSKFATGIQVATAASAVLTALFSLLHYLTSNSLFLSLAITAGTFCYHFAMRLVVGWVVPLAFRNHLKPNSFWFRSRRFEPGLYRRLRVRRWKGKMPTYNPREFSFEDNTPQQIIQNSCVSELVHEVIAVLSYLPLLAVPRFGALPVFLITSLLASALDGCFVILQRYNRPRLIKYSGRIHKT